MSVDLLACVPSTVVLPADEIVRPTTILDVETLYRRYGDMVLGRCRSLLGNDADAQEVCQEIFLRLYRYRERFRGEASPTTYLFRVTTTTCLNRIRTRRRRPEDPYDEVPSPVHHDTMLSTLELRDLVDRVLDIADDGTRDALVYHFVDGMTYDEVGDLLGVSGAAIRKRIGTFRRSIADNPPAWLREEAP